ncbi:hypothetical protein [uncultured Akkermansia sp.]|uniref:hypothetical protein n=1 Tax=uncultured Akkermansia sp. TaxID=512294 RepID=UPI00260AB82F|nr:hypothetical protein [uncultured Akkermansia sp.]
MTTHQHIIDRGPFKGMVETLTNNKNIIANPICYMCGTTLKDPHVWGSLIGNKNGVFTTRFLCPLCAGERLNGIPDEAERCWNYTQAAQSGPRITKILTYLTYLIFWCVLVSAGGTFLFLIFLLLKNLF